jgi:Glucosamine 6-phosphate synthetase, contains amidotransferase and phosphosugar isomerase domains
MKEPEVLKVSSGEYENRSSHPYCIWDQLHSAPEELRACLSDATIAMALDAAKGMIDHGVDSITFTGTGSSYGPSIFGTYALAEIADMSCRYLTSYEFVHYPQGGFGKRDGVVVLSHTGGTQVAVQSAELARKAGGYAVAITDVPTSKLAKASDKVLLGPGGLGWAIPTTRSYLADLFCTLILVVAIGEQKKPGTLEKWMKELKKIPGYVEESIKIADAIIPEIAKKVAGSRSFYVASVGPNCTTAYDCALKFEEISWIPAIGNEAEEAIHGPLMSIGTDSTVVLIAPEGNGYERVERIAKAMQVVKVPVVSVAKSTAEIQQYSNYFAGLPFDVPEVITPLLYIVPLFELTYWVSIYNGHNPDSLDRTNPLREKSHAIMTPPGTH